MTIPRAEARYLDNLVAVLRDLLGDGFVGVYPTGSVALDGYRPGRSDLDLIAVADHPSPATLAAVAGALGHDALPCPATGLEFVLYDRSALARVGNGAGFALNLNTGRELPAKVATDPGDGPGFWYPIDRDITAQEQRVLAGPPFAGLVHRQPYDTLLPVVAASVEAHRDAVTDHGDNAVLNGCRALRYHAERRWSAKPVAAAWALAHAPGFESLINAAIDSHGRDRAAGRSVAIDDAAAFLDHVARRLRTTHLADQKATRTV